MQNKDYFPKFIANWAKIPQGIQIYALKKSITLEEMDVNTMFSIEKICSGKNHIDTVIDKLSKNWDHKDVLNLINCFIENQIIVNIYEINPLIKKHKLKKIQTILPNQDILKTLKLPYSIVYGRPVFGIWSSGKGIDINIATSKLISEIAEWNAWDFPKNSSIISGSFKELSQNNNIIKTSNIVNYASFQYEDYKFPYKAFNPELNHNWIYANSLKNNEQVLVSSEHILFKTDSIYTKTTSSGCSAHIDRDKAINHTLYELIERDAFMIYWLNKLDRPKIDLNSLPNSLISRISNIQNLGYRVIIKDISMGIAPVIIIAVQDLNNVYITSGLASSHDFESMFNSALSEVEVSLLHILNSKKITRKIIKPEMIKTLVQHELLHQQKEYANETSFLFESDQSISFKDFSKAYTNEQDIRKILFDKGFDIYIIDATDWEIDVLLPEHRYIVRTIVPGLVPLTYGYNQEPFGMPRIYDTPVDLGFCTNRISYEKINRFPHPFN